MTLERASTSPCLVSRRMADKVPPFRNVTKRPGPPKAAGARLQALFAPHVHSFDYFLDEGLSRCVAGLEAQARHRCRRRCTEGQTWRSGGAVAWAQAARALFLNMTTGAPLLCSPGRADAAPPLCSWPLRCALWRNGLVRLLWHCLVVVGTAVERQGAAGKKR